MALVTRYYGPTALGAGNGTTPANCMAFFVSGRWTTDILNFDFTSDALEARVLPGTYTYTNSNSLSPFTAAAPNAVGQLYFVGCDASGNPLQPDSRWTSDQPTWDDSDLIFIDVTTNVTIAGVGFVSFSGFKFRFSANTNRQGINSTFSWCTFYFVTSGNTSNLVSGKLKNCSVDVAIDSFTAAWASGSSVQPTCYNCRFTFSGGGTGSGNRHGISSNGTSNGVVHTFSQCFVIGFPGAGLIDESTTTPSRTIQVDNCTVVGNGTGIKLSSTASQTGDKVIESCIVTGSGGAGIDLNGANNVTVRRCRLRDNAGGDIVNAGNTPTDIANVTTAGTDATDYNDPTSGDYRIKDTSIAAKGIGVSAVTSGGGGNGDDESGRGSGR